MLIRNLFQIFFSVFYGFSCIGLGIFIISHVPNNNIRHKPALIKLATSFILGTAIIAAIWMLLGLAGQFRLTIILLVLLVGIILGLPYFFSLFKECKQHLKNVLYETQKYSWGWMGIAITSIGLLLFGALSMRTWTGDAIAYYLAVPKVLASTNRLSLLPAYENFMSVGLLGEMHSAVFQKLSMPMGIKYFSGMNYLALIIMLFGISTEVGLKTRGKWLVLASYVTSSAIYLIVGDGKTDIIAAALGVAAYYFALIQGPYLLVGLFCGFSGTMKLSYLVTLFPGIAIIYAWHQIKLIDQKKISISIIRKNLALYLQKGFQIVFWCLLASLPHLIKNGMLLNAPFAPIGVSGIGWLDQNFYGPETTRRILLSYPFATTFGNYWAQNGNLSPLVLAFFPFILLLPRDKRFNNGYGALFVAGLVGMIIWLIRFPSVLAPRYYLATLLIFIPLSMRGVEYLMDQKSNEFVKFTITICTWAILVLVGINSLDFFRPRLIVKHIANDYESSCEFGGSFCTVENEINKIAQPGDRVYLASWYRLYLRPDLLQCTNGQFDTFVTNSASDIWKELYKKGFSYLITDGSRPEFDPIVNQPPSWVKYELVTTSYNVSAYHLIYINPPIERKPFFVCESIDDRGTWKLKIP